MGDNPGKDGGLEMDVDLLIPSPPARSTHKQLMPGHPELAAYLAGAVPEGGREGGTWAQFHTLQGKHHCKNIYKKKKVQLHPEENRVREQSPGQVCRRVSRE